MEVITQEAKQVVEDAKLVVSNSTGMTISNNNDFEVAGNQLKQIKSVSKQIIDTRKKMTVPLDTSKKAIMDFFRVPLESLSKGESLLKNSMLGYTQEQERKRRQEEQRLQIESDKRAEAERKKLEKKAERLETKGKPETAQEVIAQKEQIVAPKIHVNSTVSKVVGVSSKKVWTYEITDIKKIPRNFMIPNERLIRDTVKATKGSLEIAGVRIYQEDSLYVRS